MDVASAMDLLKNQIEQRELKSLYLFYGEEGFLIDTYRGRIKKSLLTEADELMNLDELEGAVAVDHIIACAETFPLMVDRRLVIVQDSGYFAPGKSENDVQALSAFFEYVPPETVLIFIESKVDKRSRTFKALEANGMAVEFKALDEEGLAKWIMIEARRRKLRIEKLTAQYLIHYCGTDMSDLNMEMNKLFSYKEGTGIVERKDIEDIVTMSLETNVFHMMDAIGNQRVQEAYRIYQNLLKTGENDYYIFSLVRRQIDMLFKTAVYQRDHYDASSIARAMGIRDFMARKNMQQASKFPIKKLSEAMDETLKYDVGIKSGTITAGRAIELLIAKYGSRMASRV